MGHWGPLGRIHAVWPDPRRGIRKRDLLQTATSLLVKISSGMRAARGPSRWWFVRIVGLWRVGGLSGETLRQRVGCISTVLSCERRIAFAIAFANNNGPRAFDGHLGRLLAFSPPPPHLSALLCTHSLTSGNPRVKRGLQGFGASQAVVWGVKRRGEGGGGGGHDVRFSIHPHDPDPMPD